MISKYQRVQEELAVGEKASMKVFGNSMLPLIKSGSLLSFKACPEYEIGDIVFCKVKGHYIDAHKIKAKEQLSKNKTAYLISNNKGYENGWTTIIYGKVVEVNGERFQNN